MLSIDEPGGAMRSTGMWVRTTMAWACDRSPTSPRTTARSTFPAANCLADSTVVPVSMTFSRTGAPSETSWPAIADIAFAPSPSIVPTASERVTGRLYQRYPNRPAPVQRRITPISETMRSQNGILIELMKIALMPEEQR